MRILLALLGAGAVSLALFWGMQAMIAADDTKLTAAKDYKVVDFVRVKRQAEQAQTKKRLPPKPPKKPKPPKTPEMPTPDTSSTPQNLKSSMEMPDLDFKMSLNNGMGLTKPGDGYGDMDLTPLVRINPQYPPKAKRLEVEGYVRVGFTVLPNGRVDNPVILESDPKGTFEKAALRAIRKWKFKPKIENGEAIAHKGALVFEFNLRKGR